MNRFHLLCINIKKLMEAISHIGWYKKIQNYHLLIADYCGLLKSKYTLKLPKNKNEVILLRLRAGTYDKWPIVEIILQDVYRLSTLTQKSPTTIVDLGAHIGVFSIFAKLILPKAKVYSYEPEKSNFSLLKENIRLNHCSKEIIPFQLACAVKAGIRKFYLDKTTQSGSIQQEGAVYRSTPTVSLSQIFRHNKIKVCDFLKMDIEGAEYEILYSLPQNIYQKIRRISIEYHNLNKQADLNGYSLKKYLEQQGFFVTQKKTAFDHTGYLYAIKN